MLLVVLFLFGSLPFTSFQELPDENEMQLQLACFGVFDAFGLGFLFGWVLLVFLNTQILHL